jgi:hypothetical protein
VYPPHLYMKASPVRDLCKRLHAAIRRTALCFL